MNAKTLTVALLLTAALVGFYVFGQIRTTNRARTLAFADVVSGMQEEIRDTSGSDDAFAARRAEEDKAIEHWTVLYGKDDGKFQDVLACAGLAETFHQVLKRNEHTIATLEQLVENHPTNERIKNLYDFRKQVDSQSAENHEKMSQCIKVGRYTP